MKKPDRVNILGKPYTITYVDNPADVDMRRREALWGQVDHWTRTIRVYDHDRTAEDVWETILHEVLHGIASELDIEALKGDDCEHIIGLVALALADVFVRNGWIAE